MMSMLTARLFSQWFMKLQLLLQLNTVSLMYEDAVVG